MREPVSGHEVVKKKRDCNNLEKETASLEKVKVIARIHTDFPTKFGIPRQSGLSDATGLVVFESEFRQPDALRGIEEYTHLWLLWGFSEVRQESGTWKATVRPPRLGGNERVGVFACRSPYRPNPIGLSCVKLERIISHEKYGMCLLVSGVDMMDQTPIYDIKPYLPYVDAHPEASGGFAHKKQTYHLEVHIPYEGMKKIPEEKRKVLM
jgi:tRNA (adenine37-N6)-methyltransferase